MRPSLIAHGLFVSSFVLATVAGRDGQAQTFNASGDPVRPAALAGLYRIEVPSTVSTSSIQFLRLFVDGRSRIELVRIDGTGRPVQARVLVGSFSEHPWRLKATSAEHGQQLCFEMDGSESCTAFHQEMPRGDLLLFAPDANWGSPTIILRRQGSDS